MDNKVDPWELLQKAVTFINESCDDARASPEWVCFCDEWTEVRNLRCDIYDAIDEHNRKVNNG